MAISFSCECGKPIKVRDEYAGSPVRCPQCGSIVKVPKPGEKDPNGPFDPYGLEEIEDSIQRLEYKVITQKDFWLGGKFEPERIEQVLNAYAKKGWVVRGVTAASISGVLGNRDEIIVILERNTEKSS